MSDTERWREVDALLDAALDLAPGERGAFLDARCQDPELRAQLERLLAAADKADEFLPPGAGLHPSLAEDVLEGAARHEDAGDAAAGSVIDAFRLTRKLGQGGMGEVWEAEQREPVRRQVALKLVQWGLDSKEVVRRFELERQALALMNHPNVAQVFGGGTSPSGRPYFVMEYVAGVPVTRYCDARSLSIDERLALFLQICDGVQHAHHKGLIHRDLKPSNILVTEIEGEPVPKIIDFGVARALDQRLGDESTLTELGQIVGTLEYMSPEQADSRAHDVDTRADVYALGVLLYELLAGVRPFDDLTLKAAGLLELLRRIRETDPLRPSQRAEPTLGRRLQGELDWIVMKAIEKDRARRYDSPRELAEDVRRHLSHEAVLAGPPSRAYRLRKMLRRHRATAIAAAVAVVALLAGTAVSVTQALRATRAERVARADAETARQVSDFLVELFEVSDPERGSNPGVSARELLDRGAARMRAGLDDQPLVKARLQLAMGETYRRLGVYDAAQPLLEEGFAARERQLGPHDIEVVRAMGSLGHLHFDRGDKAAAEKTWREGLARLASSPQPNAVVEAYLRLELVSVLRETARYPEAEAEARQGIALLTRELGETHEDVGKAWDTLGGILHFQARHAEAEAAFRQGLALLEQAVAADNPALARVLTNLATNVGSQGRDVEAEELLHRARHVFEQAYGPNHISVAINLGSLSAVYGRQGRLDDSLATSRRALAIREGIYGRDHLDSTVDLQNIGLTQVLKADYASGRQTLERTLAIIQKGLGPEHPRAAWIETRLGALHARLAEYDAAEAAYGRSLRATEKRFGPGHQQAASPLRGLAEVAMRRGRLDEADALMARTLAITDKPANIELPGTLNSLGELRRRQRRLDEAQQALERARALQLKTLRPGHPALGDNLVRQAEVRVAQGRSAEAQTLFREALAISEPALGRDHPDVARMLHGLGALLVDTGSADEALALLERALASRTKHLGRTHPDTLETARICATLAPSEALQRHPRRKARKREL